MRDPKVFGTEEDSVPPDDSTDDPEHGYKSQPRSMSDSKALASLAADAATRYGSALSDIKRSDLEKCSSRGRSFSMPSLQTMPLRRLSLEIKHFLTDPPSYISVAPIKDDLHQLVGSIEGPPGTPYEKGIFFIRLDYPDNYPIKPPLCNFMTRIYHPNISQGRVCVNILEKAWCPALTVESILLSICSMLADPFVDDPLEPAIAEQYVSNRVMYEYNARSWTQEYATGKRPTEEELDFAGEWNKRLAVTLERELEGETT